jgi:iron complex outermembrane receptor protein
MQNDVNVQASPRARSRELALLVGLALAGGVAVAQAQETVGLEEITVTARKTSENLQDVPITVTAFTAETLQQSNVKTLYDINNLAPGLNFQLAGTRGGSGRLQMRGTTAGTSGGSKVSVFLDGVYVSGDITNIPFEALERVEVLPGPQSAVFGRSTFAGALSYVTKSPTREFRGSVSADLAQDGEQRVSGMISGPIIDGKLGFMLDAFYMNYDGPSEWKNPVDGSQLGSNQSKGAIAKLVYDVTDSLKIEYRGMYADDEDSQGIAILQDPSTRNGVFTKLDVGAGPGTVGRVAFYPIGTIDSITSANPNGGTNSNLVPDVGRRAHGYRNALTTTYTFADYTASLLIARNREYSRTAQDGDFTTFPNSRSVVIVAPEDNSAEFRITSPQKQRFRWTAGYYYLDLQQGPGSFAGAFFTDQVCPNPTAAAPRFACTFGSTYTPLTFNLTTPLNTEVTFRDKSPFAGLFLDVTSWLTASFEGRYQQENVRSNNKLTGAVFENTFKKFLPRANLDFKLNDDVHFYALYSVGNNPGTFNTSPFIGAAGSGTSESDRFVKEETLKNYEVGIKSLWLDRRLRVNAAVYKSDWNNQQLPATFFTSAGQIFSLTLNKGSSKIKGATLEVEAAPAEGWDLRGTMSYNKAEYKSFCSTNFGALLGLVGRANQNLTFTNPITGKQFNVTTTACVPIDGNDLEGVPALTWSLGAGYQHALNASWNWSARGDFQHQDGMWDSEMNLAKSQDANVFNLTFGVNKDNLGLALYCRNCTNEDSPYRISRLSDARAGASNQFNQTVGQIPRRPRQFGLRVNVNF